MKVTEAVDALLRVYRLEGKPCAKTMPYQTKPLLAVFGGLEIDQVTSERVDTYIETRLAQGAAAATVQHETGYLRRALRLAAERGHLAAVPKIRHLKLNNARSGFLLPEDYRRIVATLEVLDEVAADIVRWLYLLGWRSREVRELPWRDVQGHLVLLPASRTKNRQPRVVPLPAELQEVVKRREAVRHGPLVFHRGGRPVRTFRRVWRRAVAARGFPDLIPHDLRRSFARNAIQAGVPEKVVMELGGWTTVETFHRYCILDEGMLAQALEQTADYVRQPVKRKWAGRRRRANPESPRAGG